MSEITPNDLPPINELDEFTAKIPELQIDTDVLAGPDGPANFQAQALANRTKYLKRVLDAVSQELIGISQAVAAAQQSADASMKKSANGADIANATTFRTNIGLGSVATHDAQASSTDATLNRIMKLAASGEGAFGLGGTAVRMPADADVAQYLRSVPSGLYAILPNASATNLPPAAVASGWVFQSIKFNTSPIFTVIAQQSATPGSIFRGVISPTGVSWYPMWDNASLVKQISSFDATYGRVLTLGDSGSFGLGSALQSPITQRGMLFSYSDGSRASNEIGITGNGVGYQSTYNTNRRGQIYQSFVDGVLRHRYTVTDVGIDNQTPWRSCWDNVNLSQPMTLNTAQTVGGVKTYGGASVNPIRLIGMSTSDALFIPFFDSTGTIRKGWLGKLSNNDTMQFTCDAGGNNVALNANGNINITPGTSGEVYHGTNQRFLVQGRNAIADSSGYWKTASPVIHIYSDGTFTTTDEAAGVSVERLRDGVYKITGCLGLNSDRAWGGDDGGITNPRCRNGMERIWNDYNVESDGSIIIKTYHRVHKDAPEFASNRLNLDKQPYNAERDGNAEWPDLSLIDIPRDVYLQVRVQMPECIEPKPAISHSNVYCNTISPAK
ncbi:hypothetical protein ABRQ07_09210 [Pectobacterium polonicum]|uniref:Phage tail protein C-terminal domain-containing protein n=1 Tax=Pectobacterium polonicum TaxID=2485124 RepID=A0ABV1P9E6_9GAMM